MKNYFISLFILFIINVFFSTQKPINYKVSIDLSQGGFVINDQTTLKLCKQWVPSLLMPILFVPKDLNIEHVVPESESYEIIVPTFNRNKNFKVEMYKNISFLDDNFKSALIRPLFFKQDFCYFGLSPGIKYENMKEEIVILNDLKAKNLIKAKIFSLDIWDLNSEKPSTNFYLGESHDDFNYNNGIIGTCENYPNDNLWGCSFKEIVFDNIKIPLINGTSQYKIYFSSETYNLIFPRDFENILSNNSCSMGSEDNLKCEGLYNDSYYVPIQLTEANEKFVITGQVDNLLRFTEDIDKKQKDFARIQLDDIDYIILPITVFKEFHIQFDGEKNLIRFYTNNADILKVKEINKEEKEKSSGFTIFIVILIILIVLGLGIGVFWFIKKGGKTEKNINKFNKFEDEETYQNMNDKVF